MSTEITRVPVIIEVLLLSERAGRLHYRILRRAASAGSRPGGGLDPGWHPDDEARQVAGLADLFGPGLLHSSSWRYEDGRLLLTYVALPDPRPDSTARRVPDGAPAVSDDPLAPAVEEVDTGPVAVHACRHLAFLQGTDPVVAATLRDLPEYREPLRRFRPDVAGGLTAPTVT